MKFKPLFDRVIIKNIQVESKSKSGLIIPQSLGDEPVLGKVLAVGNGDCFDGKTSEMAVKVGDTVLYNKYGASAFKQDGEEYFVLRQSDILLIFEDMED